MKKRVLLAKLENLMCAMNDLYNIRQELSDTAKEKLTPIWVEYQGIKPEILKFREQVNGNN